MPEEIIPIPQVFNKKENNLLLGIFSQLGGETLPPTDGIVNKVENKLLYAILQRVADIITREGNNGGSGGEYNLKSPSTVTVGGQPSGTNISGKTWQEIIQNIVAPYINPVFTSFNITGQSTTVEVGTTLSGSKIFTWAINNNSGTINLMNIHDITASLNIATNIANDGSEIIPITTIQLNSNGASQQWKAVGFDAGNSNALFNSTIFQVTARFYRFFGAAASIPTNSSEVRSLPTSSYRTGVGSFTLNTGTVHKKFYAALPSGVTITSVIDQTALNADITSSYVLTGTISVNDAGGAARTYNLYEMIVGTAYAENHSHLITHN